MNGSLRTGCRILNEHTTQSLDEDVLPVEAEMIGNQPFLRFYSLSHQSVLLIFALLLLGQSYYRFAPLSSATEEAGAEVMIEVLGDVRFSGIHSFHRPPTLKEALERAGGATERTSHATLPCGRVETGTRLAVEGKDVREIKIHVGRMEARKLLVFSIPLDLNRASAEDLCLISGIGEALAREIIAYRERRRGFRSVEELRRVKGMGEAKYRSAKPFFVVSP